MRATCDRCDVSWSGVKMSHCCSCRAVFTTPSNFDRHLTGKPDNPTCSSNSQGLVEIRAGVFAQPGPESGSESYRPPRKGHS